FAGGHGADLAWRHHAARWPALPPGLGHAGLPCRALLAGGATVSGNDLSSILPERRERAIRSYVVRAGRMTDAQRRGLDEDWPNCRLRLADGRVNWPDVFGRHGPVVLEIGFGMGDSLL